MRRIVLFSIFGLSAFLLTAQDSFLGIKPISDQVLMLKWSDGSINYGPEGEWWGSVDVVNRVIIDTTLLKSPTSFTVSSVEDANYNSPSNPLSVGLKFKVREATYAGGNTPILEHTVYLSLPTPLQPDRTYEIDFASLGLSQSSCSYLYAPASQRSESIHISQIGFVPEANYKVGYLYQWLGDQGPLDLGAYADQDFHLVDASTNTVLYTGQINKRKDIENDSPDSENFDDGPFYAGADVYECNFSDFTEPGEYKLYVPKMGVSYPFEIKEDVYREAFVTSARGLYHHRSGPARKELNSSFPKEIDHLPGVNGFKVFYSDLRWLDRRGSSQWFNQLVNNKTNTEMPEAWGGWFDAGDFDRQAVHMTVSQLLLLNYIMAPEKFVDGELNIPESGNGIPDIIDEAFWGIDLFMRCKGPTGGIIGGVEAEDHPHQTGSVRDGLELDWFTYAEGPHPSFVYAQSVIQLAIALEIAGEPNSQELFNEAAGAYNWALRNIEPGDKFRLAEEWLSAAAWMYYYTGESRYQDDFKHLYNSAVRSDGNYHTGLAGFLFADHENKDLALEETVQAYVIAEAESLTKAANQRASRLGSLTLGAWTGVGRGSTPYNQSVNIAYELTGEQKYLDVSRTTADYFLGCNAIN